MAYVQLYQHALCLSISWHVCTKKKKIDSFSSCNDFFIVLYKRLCRRAGIYIEDVSRKKNTHTHCSRVSQPINQQIVFQTFSTKSRAATWLVVFQIRSNSLFIAGNICVFASFVIFYIIQPRKNELHKVYQTKGAQFLIKSKEIVSEFFRFPPV